MFDLGLIFGTPARFFRAFDEEFDPAAGLGVPIQLEMQLRNVPEAQPDSELVTQIMPGMLEGGQGSLLPPLIASQDNPDIRVTPVLADLNLGNVHVEETGVVQLKTDDFRQFLADRLGYAQCAPLVHKSFQPSGFSGQLEVWLRADS